MPADRLTHPRIGRSRKVTALTDFEFRVWDTYRWAADDFGVMPKAASKLRGENDALRRQHTEEEVEVALQRLVEIDLVAEFEHQGSIFVCSPTWNTHQKIEHPRQTHYPARSVEVFDSMDVTTRKLFRNFHDCFRKNATSRAHVRAKRLTANGKRQPASGVITERFDLFWFEYPRKVGKDAALVVWKRLRPDNDLTNRMIAAVRTQAQYWDDPKFIPHPRTWLHQGRWKDEVKAMTPTRGQAPARAEWRDECHALGHDPACSSPERHALRLEVFERGCDHLGVCRSLGECRAKREQVPA